MKFQPNLYHWGDVGNGAGNTSDDKAKISISLMSDSAARAKEKSSGRPKARTPTRSLRSFLRRWPPKQRKHRAPPPLSKDPKAAEIDLEAAAATNSGVSASSDHAESSSRASSGLGDKVDGGTDVLEVWFAGCHTGKYEYFRARIRSRPHRYILRRRWGRFGERLDEAQSLRSDTMLDGSRGRPLKGPDRV